MVQNYDAVIIGGGFFGCKIATSLPRSFKKMIIIEKAKDLMQRASYINQARVHNGYHYPRSFSTAVRSRINYPRFVKEFSSCIDHTFDHYYAIGKHLSKVTLPQYLSFCERVGLPIRPAPEKIQSYFDPEMIDGVYRVKESVFDAVKLKKHMLNKINKRRIQYKLGAKVIKIAPGNKLLTVRFRIGPSNHTIYAKQVFNCTYSAINQINSDSRLPIIPLKHEVTEMALVKVPSQLSKIAITLMCGPFFSVMPFPSRNLHCLSHVRYTPHLEWYEDEAGKNYKTADGVFSHFKKLSSYPHMIRDAGRYVPLLKESGYVESIWEIKTLLPESEFDDSRPILYVKDHGLKNYTCVMGGKIDNVYDILKEIDAEI